MSTYRYIKDIFRDELKAVATFYRESKLMIFIAVAGVTGIVLFLNPFPDRTINLGTSNINSDWSIYAKKSAKYLESEGFHLNAYPSEGSIDNLNQLSNPSSNINAGFAYGMTINEAQHNNVVSLGSIDYQPVWLFYRKNNIKHINSLSDLAKYRVALGPLRSGSYAISKNLFMEYGIDVAKHSNFMPDQFSISGKRLLANEVDAFITVSSAQDQEIQELLHAPGIALYSFQNADGLARKYDSLETVTLPAGSIDVFPPLPAQDVKLVATTTSLVVKESMHPDTQLGLIIAARNMLRNSESLFFSKRNEFPAYVDPRIRLSPVAARFYDQGPPLTVNYMPVWLAGFTSRAWVLLLTLFAIFFPLSKLNLQMRKFQFIVRQRPLYEELLEIEGKITKGPINIEDRDRLLLRLDQINELAIAPGVPAGNEESYFALLNSITLLRQKVEKL